MTTPMSWWGFIPKLLKSQLFVRIPASTADFSGQTIIITGSNTGIGLETARQLATLGAAKIILAVRTPSKGEAAKAHILAVTKITKDVIDVWPLDLSSLDSMLQFGERVAGLKRLDAVIQNAGILSPVNVTYVGEDEAHIAVNTIAATLVGLLVLPKLRETSKIFETRTSLSFNGSDTHYIAAVSEAAAPNFDSIMDALRDETLAKQHIGARYSVSKLLLLYAVREIAARSPISPDSNVVINYVTPGLCKSDLQRDDMNPCMQVIMAIGLGILQRSTETGGRTLVHAIEPNAPSTMHGAFLMDLKVTDTGPGVMGERGQLLAKRFVKELFERLEHDVPGIIDVLI